MNKMDRNLKPNSLKIFQAIYCLNSTRNEEVTLLYMNSPFQASLTSVGIHMNINSRKLMPFLKGRERW